MSTGSTVKTALCLIPPENVWQQIQSIRSVHDKAYPRWMPHINLVYPFVPESEFANIKAQLETMVNAKNPFEFTFDKTCIDYFKQKGSECTFHLRPKVNKDVVELQQIIENLLPNHLKSSRAFQAHLTLGQATTSRISDVLVEIKANWKTIQFTVDRVCMISRENDPNDLFSIKNQILLVGTGQKPNDEIPTPVESSPSPSPSPTPIIKEIPRSIRPIKHRLCIIPPNEFSTRLLHLFEDTSFRPLKPFEITLAEYDYIPNESDLRSQIGSISKFMVDFGARSICFNYSTSRLFLKPSDVDPIRQLVLNKNDNFDGGLTLGELNKSDLTEVGNRFTQNWTYATNEFEVDRVHLLDGNGRFQYSIPLRSQCFS